jgi:hypothetical protein
MRRLLHPFAVRHQDHGETIPTRKKATKAHRPRAAFGVVGINVFDRVERESNQDDDMTADSAVRCVEEIGGITAPARRSRTQADRRTQSFVDGVVENAAATAAWILHAIVNARFLQRYFQTARTTRAGMAVGESVNRFQTMMASQCLQGAPAATARRTILDPAVGRDVYLRMR